MNARSSFPLRARAHRRRRRRAMMASTARLSLRAVASFLPPALCGVALGLAADGPGEVYLAGAGLAAGGFLFNGGFSMRLSLSAAALIAAIAIPAMAQQTTPRPDAGLGRQIERQGDALRNLADRTRILADRTRTLRDGTIDGLALAGRELRNQAQTDAAIAAIAAIPSPRADGVTISGGLSFQQRHGLPGAAVAMEYRRGALTLRAGAAGPAPVAFLGLSLAIGGRR